jgi:hypothetical protein
VQTGKRLLIFVLLGPLILFLVAFAPFAPKIGAPYYGEAVVLGLLIVYACGFLPAIALAFLDMWLSTKLRDWTRVVAMAVFGASLSSVALPSAFTVFRYTWSSTEFALMGGLAAAICAWLAGRVRNVRQP